MAVLVIDEGSINSPANTHQRSRYQTGIKRSAFANQGDSVSVSHEVLHFHRVSGARVIVDLDARLGKQFQKACVSFGVLLRVIKNPEIPSEVRRP